MDMNSKAPQVSRIIFFSPIAVLILSSCVSGPPSLSDDQEHKLSSVSTYPLGQTPAQPYTVLGNLSAADCSGSPMGGRVTGRADRALDTLKRKAVAINADSIIEVSCGTAPMVNNCWAAQECTGKAISFLKPPPDGAIDSSNKLAK
jgi:hypothetical protein